MYNIIIPPIKSQGIKTKFVPWINNLILQSGFNENTCWVEPFFGTGAIGFNSPLQATHIVGDTNPHIINFYRDIQNELITSMSMRRYLEAEGKLLRQNGAAHFIRVRDRFNMYYNSYDFLFLSRTAFGGMMRFNNKGHWNAPFCKNPDRFSTGYITKVCNQIEHVIKIICNRRWQFYNLPFNDLIEHAEKNDLIYCDPPYGGRYADCFNSWTEDSEKNLYSLLKNTPAKFILSTWCRNDYRENEMIKRYWKNFNIITKDFFYYNGEKVRKRHTMTEALIFNFDLSPRTTFPTSANK